MNEGSQIAGASRANSGVVPSFQVACGLDVSPGASRFPHASRDRRSDRATRSRA